MRIDSYRISGLAKISQKSSSLRGTLVRWCERNGIRADRNSIFWLLGLAHRRERLQRRRIAVNEVEYPVRDRKSVPVLKVDQATGLCGGVVVSMR